MKRAGQLMAAIADPENLRLAFWKAAKGKRAKSDCRAFQQDLDHQLDQLRGNLLAGNPPVGNYNFFTIHDPKERRICAASFRERVLHHALMNLCEPVLEKAAIFDSYACRTGKGRLAAIKRATDYAHQYGWYLKLDIRRYFDSVDQNILRRLLGRRFKDAAVFGVFDRIIGSYQTQPGRGLPIGNLTSQHFANFYLGPLDRFVKETLGREAYLRYMDDFVIWGESPQELRQVRDQVREFLAAQLNLELKANWVINRTVLGIDFLGYRIFPGTLRLARRSKRRFARKFRAYQREWLRGRWTELQLQQRVQALLAFIIPADTVGLRRRVLDRFGVVAIGLEPRPSRRQLEQQRQELPGGEPQQQLAGQHEQQQRVPLRPASSSIPASECAGTDPAAIPSGAAVEAPANRESAARCW